MELTKISAADGSEIYIQYDETDIDELHAVMNLGDIIARTKLFKRLTESTVRGYLDVVLNAVKTGMKDHPPDRVALQFSLQIGGEAGVPYITKGTAQGNVSVTVEWNALDVFQN